MFKILTFFFLFGKLAFCAEPNLLVNIKNVVVTNNENPILGDISVTVHPQPKENTISLYLDIKDAIPEDTMALVTVLSENGKKKEIKITLCDAIHEIMLGHDIFSHLVPEDQAPKQCPINPATLRLENYLPNKAMIPPGILKDGTVHFKLEIKRPNEEPYTTFEIELEISHDSLVPKMG